jgi:spore coat protein JC
MPDKRVAGLLVDIGTEELGHMEMVGELVKQLSRGLSTQQIIDAGMDAYFVDHTIGIYPAAANGMPFTAATIQSVGDPLADLSEDMAAEQKARVTYDNILKLVDDPDVCDVIRFLREREIVHYQRFAEALNMVREGLDARNIYAINPAFPPRNRK